MTEVFNESGSLYVLINTQWKKVGAGKLMLLTNVHNPTHILIKVVDKNGNAPESDTGTVFQCKPKTKPKGNKSHILKGVATQSNTVDEYIMAARFKNEDTATIFKAAMNSAAEMATTTTATTATAVNGDTSQQKQLPRMKKTISLRINDEDFDASAHKVTPKKPSNYVKMRTTTNGMMEYDPKQQLQQLTRTTSNSTISEQQQLEKLATQEWDCSLCTSHNPGHAMQCQICKSPRLIIKQAADAYEESVNSHDSTTLSSGTAKDKVMETPSFDYGHANLSVMYGDAANLDSPATSPKAGALSPGGMPYSPMSPGSFDWSSALANDKLALEPSPDGGDVDSRKEDFVRILTNIDSNLTTQDASTVFTDLAKVAKRLARKDPKYRVLDLKNPMVHQRLTGIEGIDAYLAYLGFEEADNEKLICPDDQPPRSVILIAQEVCQEFLDEHKKKQHIFALLQRSSNNFSAMGILPLSPADAHDEVNLKPPLTQQQQRTANDDDDDDDDGKQQPQQQADDAASQSQLQPPQQAPPPIPTDPEQFTLRQLVWSITHESNLDNNKTCEVVLLCHGVFSDSINLLQLLMERFAGEKDEFDDDSITFAAADAKLGVADRRWRIQVKVASMLTLWLKSFWEQDFVEHPDLMPALEAFFDTLESDYADDKRVKVLLKKMRGVYDMLCDKMEEEEEKQLKKHKTRRDFGAMFKPKGFSITEQKAVTLAEQFTLRHFKTFQNITKRECLGQRWKKKDGQAQNILDMIKLFNQTAKWVQVLILTQPSLHKRVKVMRLCVDIATYMKNFRNFSGSCAFHSAMASTAIYRLKVAWSKLSSADTKKWKALHDTFGYDGAGYKLLRKLHRQAHAPAILHTGLFLQDLVGIDEGHENKLKNGTVNFKKLLKLHEKIDTIAMYQQETYKFKEDLVVQSVFQDDFDAQEKLDDDFLYTISCNVKAADEKKK